MSTAAIEVKELVKKFADFTAVNRISFTVGQGEVFGFLGPNGAGKTTTIRMLCGLINPTAGTARVGGYEVGKQNDQIKQHIGYMSQKFSLYNDLTIEQNIELYAGLYQTDPRKREQKKREILAMADLVGKEKVPAGEMAGAMKQHLALGCAMIHEPRIIFLDEPTAGVDPISRRAFWKAIATVARNGVTVLVTTHYMDEAEQCDRIAMISAGDLIALDSPANLKTQVSGSLLEIECDNVMAALEVLRATKAAADVALYGVYLHAMVESDSALGEIKAVLAGKGLNIARIEKITPSLEDVFVFRVEQAARAKEGSR
ncbi:MAG: ABC transporter ATP-binding protein [Candidatus Margulisbacteria bacterium]|jgi:ABC-2 type transport system ATP-binding protein|nr:ABC transporter ATP-binding protein [Candidatus Margulisiibacteriota bacterium]